MKYDKLYYKLYDELSNSRLWKSAEDNTKIPSVSIDTEIDAQASLDQRLTFVGTGATLPAVEDSNDGDVYVINADKDSGKEFVFSDGAWRELSDASDYEEEEGSTSVNSNSNPEDSGSSLANIEGLTKNDLHQFCKQWSS